VAPQALYAVNEHVPFSPYRTTFELAEVTVDDRHWSVTGRGAEPDSGSDLDEQPGFSGASGNAC
jgi:peptide/nickel transport system substrate-binding protein